eukprot:scaffold26865_cov137-Skeletonema_menzelii.AAC.1
MSIQPLNYNSSRSGSVTSITNPFTGQELLKLLDEDLNDTTPGSKKKTNPALGQQDQQLLQLQMAG